LEHVAHSRQGGRAQAPPEKTVRSLLHRMGYRFRLHVRIEVGRAVPSAPSGLRPRRGAVRTPRPTFARPDILLPKYKTAIFVHGCFWHRHKGCKNCTTPTNRREWWLAKLNGNAARDKLHQAAHGGVRKHLACDCDWGCETANLDWCRGWLFERESRSQESTFSSA
jgi:DNA mismatch endonuclease Vsr